MSIIIKGMDMPKGAEQIWVDVWGSQGLLANKILSVDEIVEIPKPHGRLIDADALGETIFKINLEEPYITRNDYKLIENVLFEMPTIIEEEK